jgi:hypothetical protein
MTLLKKTLDKYPKEVYNILSRDGERSIDLSHFPRMFTAAIPAVQEAREEGIRATLELWYNKVTDGYNSNPSLFVSPPVFSGGFFRDIIFGGWPNDLDLFVNSHGLSPEEAEDNLCLFLSSLGEKFTEDDNPEYAGNNAMRVFDFPATAGEVCKFQVILKDMGPPSDDPLYVTEDFHYNHGKFALSVTSPEVHIHSHAVAGFRHKMHVYNSDSGLKKCKDLFYGQRDHYKWIDLRDPQALLETPLERKNAAIKKRNAELEQYRGVKNPCAEIVLDYRRPMF